MLHNKEKLPAPFLDGKIDIETLAKQQGVAPVTNFVELLGNFWPEEQSADEFIAATRAWCTEGEIEDTDS